MTDWIEITRRNARSVQTTVGWIFWDPGAVERYRAAGLPEQVAGPLGYMAARCAPLAGAGPDAVIAAFGSISPTGIRGAFELLGGPDRFRELSLARDAAIDEGLRRHAPDIVEPLVELGPALWAVVDQVRPPLDYRDLGIAVYRADHAWWWPWRSELRRVHRVRASRRPVSSDVAWRPGKGVIGACVTQGEVVAVDLAQMSADLGQPSAEEWRQVPDDLRMGLDHDEYLDVRDKYAVVVASPIIDDSGHRSRVVGCLALDGPEGRLTSLSSDEVLGLLNFTGQALLSQVG